MRTATVAATMVLPMYRISTSLNLDPMPCPDAARELITSTKTSIGAIALRASTNTVPSRPMGSIPGTTRARTAPMSSPASMRKIRLMDVHLS